MAVQSNFFLPGNGSPGLPFQQHKPVSFKYMKTQLAKSQVFNAPFKSETNLTHCMFCNQFDGKKIREGKKGTQFSLKPLEDGWTSLP